MNIFNQGFGFKSIAATFLSGTLLLSTHLFSGVANATYWGDDNQFIAKENFQFNPRNQVLLYLNESAPYNEFYHVGRHFYIRFVGLNGVSSRYRMADYYQLKVMHSQSKKGWLIARPPYATPFSAGCNPNIRCTSSNHVDVLNIPIPAYLGPIVGVIVDVGGDYKFLLDKIVADGRSFSFKEAQGPMYTRYSTHLALGQKVGNYNIDYPAGLYKAAEMAQQQFGDGQSVLNVGSDLVKEKTVTFRIKFDGIDYFSSNVAAAPEVELSVVGSNGDSVTATTQGPMILDQRWASIKVPLNFEIDTVLLSHAGSNKTIDVKEIGFVVEEELAPEIRLQGRARLNKDGGASKFNRFQTPYAALTDSEQIERIQGQSADAVFSALSHSSAESQALQRFRSNTRVLGELSFDEWFLSAEGNVHAEFVLTSADALFTDNDKVSKAWNDRVRGALKRAMDDRTLALSFVDRMEKLTDRLARIATDELSAAQKFLDLETDKQADFEANKPEADVFNNTMTATMGVLSVAQSLVPVPEVVMVVKALGMGLKGVQTVVNMTREKQGVTGTVDISRDQDRNRQLLAFGDAILDYGRDYDRAKVALKTLRSTVVRDIGILEQMAAFEVQHLRHASMRNASSGDRYDEAFHTAASAKVREKILRTFLPLRGVLVGESIRGVEIPVWGYQKQFDQEVNFGYSSDGFRYHEREANSARDDVLAYSAYIVQTKGNDGLVGVADYSMPVLKGQRWRMGIGKEAPLIAAEQQRPDGRTLWDYITDAMKPIEVFNLLAYADEKLVIHDDVYECDDGDRNDGWQCFAQPDSKRYSTVPFVGNTRVAKPVRTLTVTGNPDDFRTVKNRFSLDSKGQYKFIMQQVTDDEVEDEDDDSTGTLVPQMWVVLYSK